MGSLPFRQMGYIRVDISCFIAVIKTTFYKFVSETLLFLLHFSEISKLPLK